MNLAEDRLPRSVPRRGLTVVAPDGRAVLITVVLASGVGEPASCPGPHPSQSGERCGRVLTHLLTGAGDQVIKCQRCGRLIRIQGGAS